MEKALLVEIPDTLPYVSAVYTIGSEVIGTDLAGELRVLATTREMPILEETPKDSIVVEGIWQIEDLCIGLSGGRPIALARFLPVVHRKPRQQRRHKATIDGGIVERKRKQKGKLQQDGEVTAGASAHD